MSALASALLDMGAAVSGSDAIESDATRALATRGARVLIGHDAANLRNATRVVVSAAVPADNPELLHAQANGVPIIKRAALLGMLMDSKRGVAVAGTHGKTTTSAMIAWVLVKSGRDPSYMVGGSIRGLGSGGHWGGGPVLVAEADEYDRSFLTLHPNIAVITSMDADHLDIYGDHAHLTESFKLFASQIKTQAWRSPAKQKKTSRRRVFQFPKTMCSHWRSCRWRIRTISPKTRDLRECPST